MSGDEVVVLIASLIAGPGMWAAWAVPLSGLQPLRRKRSSIAVLMSTLASCALLLLFVLATLSAPDVRDDPGYLALYLVMGLAWMRMGEAAFSFAGVSARDDVVERRNHAATPVIVGALIGVTCCFSGGNVGSGPGWWVVVFSAGIATATWMALWLAVDHFALVVDTITIDRDAAAGMRLGGWLIATGIVLGRAVAGDWRSAESTLRDFARLGWVVVPLAIAAVGVERHSRSGPRSRPVSTLGAGVLAAFVYVAVAIVYVSFLGRPA